ncbi:MAG TPA: hypothetical protein VIJ51_12295 [Solirubrobacteraceae bacterium]
MLGKAGQLWIWTAAGQDLGVTPCDEAPTLTLKCFRDDCSATASGAGANDLVNEFD